MENIAVVYQTRSYAPTIGLIQLDASLSEDHQYENMVTEFPVETGETITDHIFNKPIKLNITGFITNHPIKRFTNVRSSASYSESSYDTQIEEKVHVKVVYDALMDLWRKRQPVDIITPLSSYKDMALVSLAIPRNAQVGKDSLHFTATFLQILFASAKYEDVNNLDLSTTGAKGGTDKIAAKTADGGTQTPEEIEADKGTSLVFKLVQ